MKPDAGQAEKRVVAFAELCRQRGIKATRQRTEIYREIARTGEHPDAETIHRRVRERMPQISLDTVYRNLRLLEDEGIVSRMGLAGDRMRFDGNTDRHHHFVCTGCGLVVDFYSDRMDRLEPPPDVSLPGAVDSVHVEVRGLCRACQKKGK